MNQSHVMSPGESDAVQHAMATAQNSVGDAPRVAALQQILDRLPVADGTGQWIASGLPPFDPDQTIDLLERLPDDSLRVRMGERGRIHGTSAPGRTRAQGRLLF